MEDDFYEKNVTCCSVELHWTDKNKKKNNIDFYEYELFQKEDDGQPINIYSGKDINYEAFNLKPNKHYLFTLNIIKDKNRIENKKIKIKTLESPQGIISKNSFKLSKNEKLEYHFNLSNSQKNIIKNCCKLIFDEDKDNKENIIIGDFDGIEMKITTEFENHKYIYYISFEVKPYYYEEFFGRFNEELDDNMITPCHFIIPKLPTILIFNLLSKGAVIFTGKRMGGVIASSLAFYIIYLGLEKNINYGNAFLNSEQNCIGVVTFGSPTFLNDLTAGYKMREKTSYFYHIKEEFDYIPEIIDFINKKQSNYIQLVDLFQKKEFLPEDKKQFHIYLDKNNFTDAQLIKNVNIFRKLPFGYYFMFNAIDNSLKSINESNFNDFYYFKPFLAKNPTSGLKVYETLKSNIKFNKEMLEFLTNKNYQLEFIKIIRREINSNSIKGIIKFKLMPFENNIISPDIINKIKLISNNATYEINSKDIYYDNDVDITAYVNDLNENIKDIIITNNFHGEIKIKNIINIKGSNSTREMLKNNIEKLFLFPFFKLIEIFYASLNDNETYEKLKKQNFGNDFEELVLLKSFQKQINTINELLFLSRPDILGKFEKFFIKEYINEELTEKQNEYLNDIFKTYYKHAAQLQIKQNIKCLDSEEDSIAKKIPFPQKFKGQKGIKKLFMCENKFLECDNIITEKLDDSYIKKFFLEQLIKETLQSEEKLIKSNLNHKNKEECKKYLNSNIGGIYNELIIPNIYFIKTLILSSLESGDEIKFNHNIDLSKISLILLFPLIWLKPLGEKRAKYERDFEKNYSGNDREQLNTRNLYNKTKIKNIVESKLSSDEKDENQGQNKIFEFSKFSENQTSGEEYYKKFLHLLNNYSNDFPQDIEISIYDNLKEENKNKDKNFSIIKEMMEELINEEESKKGFLALVRQSYFIGQLRTNIVSI